jgi:PAS domain S-box-containing protein
MLNDLEAAILRDPLIARADATVLSAVEQMSGLSGSGRNRLDENSAASTSVVIMSAGQQVLGILTGMDVIFLAAQQQSLSQLTLEQFLQQHRSPSANVAISESTLSDVTAVIAHFEQQQISHLPILNAQNQLVGVLLYESLKRLKDIADSQAAALLLVSQQKIFERIAKAEPLTDILNELLHMMEFNLLGTVCSITLCQDGRLTDMLAPSLPSDYTTLIPKLALPIAEGIGSCGTAAFRRELVTVTDIEHDPLWQDYKSLILGYGLQACTAIPVFSSEQTLLGVFGIYYREQKAPQAQEVELIAQAAHIAGIAIERDRATQVLQQLNQELESRVQLRTQELKEREQFLQTVLDTFPLKVFWKDVNSVYLGCNQHFLHDAGLRSIDEVIGKTDYDLPWAETEADFYRADDRAVIETQTAKLGIVEPQHQGEGQPIWLETNKLPLRNLQGEVIGVMGTYQDISDRKAAELAVQASEAKFRRITESVPGMIYRYVLHPDGSHSLSYVSPQVQQIYELTPTAMLQDSNILWARFHPEDVADIQRAVQSSADSLQAFFVEGRLLLPSEKVKWVQVSSRPELQENGDIIWDGVIIDITDRKAVEFEQQRQLAILDSTSDIISTIAPDGTILYLNQAGRNLLQPDGGELTNWIALYEQHPAWALERLRNEAIPAAIQHGTWLGETAIVNGHGQEIPVSQAIIAHKSRSGELEYLSTIIRDISVQKQTEQRLKRKRQHLEALLNNLPHIAWIKDEQSRFIAVNEPFAQACGVPVEEVVGKTDYDIWPADLAQAYRDDDFQVLQSGQRKVVEEKISLANGTIGWIETTKTPFRNDQQVFVGTVGIGADITDRKTMELALQESERRYSTLAAAAPVAIFRLDRLANCTYVNDRWGEMTGRPLESAMGKGWWDAVHPDDLDQILLSWAHIIANPTPGMHLVNDGEGRHLRPDGTINWVYIQTVTEFDGEGNLIGYIGTLTDITDRKMAELALQESQAQFRYMTENVPGMLYRYIWHPDGTDDLTYVSSQIREMFELEPDVALGDPSQLWGRVHPDDIARIEEAAKYSATTLEPFTSEYRLLLPQQGLRWVQNQSRTERLDDGTVIWDGVVLDTTARKNAELALQDLSARLEFALKGANIGIWEWQMSDQRLLWDERMCALYGIAPEEFSGEYEDWLLRVHPEDRDGARIAEQQAFQGARECRVEFRIIWPDGTIRFIDSYAFNQRNAQGEIQKTIGLNIDITDRKQADAQLQRSNEELARATRLKDEFLANMSHELRTPLNAILGMTEILQAQILGQVNDQQQQSLQTIEKSSTHLLELINDILDVAKIEAGQIELNCQPTDIAMLCQGSLAFIKQQAFNKNIELKLAVSSSLPKMGIDERRIRQVLVNLLNNAIKFTPKGGKVTLQVNCIPYQSSDANLENMALARDTLEISVIDTGIGIAPDQIDRLFQPFVQVESALNRNYNGTGLGLALVKRLVKLHGGTVELTSELGAGSCFKILIPAASFMPASVAPESSILDDPEAIAGDRSVSPVILLAEDNEANISTFVSYLSSHGYRLIVATDGQMAINMAQKKHPDVILMDIQMPGMDGLEAIQRFRLLPEFADTPIIALTALAMPGDRERCLAAGANDYLSKPVALKELISRIKHYLHLNSF